MEVLQERRWDVDGTAMGLTTPPSTDSPITLGLCSPSPANCSATTNQEICNSQRRLHPRICQGIYPVQEVFFCRNRRIFDRPKRIRSEPHPIAPRSPEAFLARRSLTPPHAYTTCIPHIQGTLAGNHNGPGTSSNSATKLPMYFITPVSPKRPEKPRRIPM